MGDDKPEEELGPAHTDQIGVALSGGGHRASMFGLGVLLYLVDACRNTDVVQIASVSGGSITNAYVGLRENYRDMDGPRFRAQIAPLTEQIANRGCVSLRSRIVLTYLVLGVAAISGVAIVIWWVLTVDWYVKLLLSGLSAIIWLGLMLETRLWVFGRSLDSAFFAPGEDGRAKLRDLCANTSEDEGVHHVICATDITVGRPFYLSSRFVKADEGRGTPSEFPLHKAVMASAAFPGLLPPLIVRTNSFGLTKSTRAYLPLADGGVYDNLGAPWFLDADKARSDNEEWLPSPTQLIIVNSSTSRVKPFRKKPPIIREFLALKRSMEVLYQSSGSFRAKELDRRFANATFTDDKPGVVVSIEENPFDCLRKFEKTAENYRDQKLPPAWEECHARAKHADRWLREAGEDTLTWEGMVDTNSHYDTNLKKLGKDCTGNLIRHGYTVAMVKLHVFFPDYPLVEIPHRNTIKGMIDSVVR